MGFTKEYVMGAGKMATSLARVGSSASHESTHGAKGGGSAENVNPWPTMKSMNPMKTKKSKGGASNWIEHLALDTYDTVWDEEQMPLMEGCQKPLPEICLGWTVCVDGQSKLLPI